jgi:hypothetical protein
MPRVDLFSLLSLFVFLPAVVCQAQIFEIRGLPQSPSPPGATKPVLSATNEEPATIVAPCSDPRAAEIRFTDGSALRVNLLDEKLEFVTPYGKLAVPMSKIRRLELATRVPEAVRKKVEAFVADLGSSQFAERETASKGLVELGAQGYPLLLKYTQHKDAEIAGRVEQVLDQIRDQVPEDQQEPRADDVLETVDSKITGQLVLSSFKAETAQFGDQGLKLSDIRTIRRLNATGSEAIVGKVENDPGNLTNYREQVGKTFQFRVTGTANGSLWGSGTYTTDSSLATAAVHTGLLKVGQTGVVKVTIVPAPESFSGSSKNGVTSYDYTSYPSAYKLKK